MTRVTCSVFACVNGDQCHRGLVRFLALIISHSASFLYTDFSSSECK